MTLGNSSGSYGVDITQPSEITVNATIKVNDVDSESTELSNITVRSSYDTNLVFKNVKIK